MEKKMIRISRIILLMLVLVSLVVLGCRQAPPPGQTPPPGGSAQMPAPGGSAQMPASVGTSAQVPPPAGTVQMPAPAGTVPTPQAGTPSGDPNQVHAGMTPEQVLQIMGPPEQFYQKGFIEWKYLNTPIGKVDIRFKDNKVQLIEEYNKKK
jgi:hypothetical protein